MNDFFEKDKNDEKGPNASEAEHLDEAISFLENAKQKGVFEEAYIPYLNLGQAYYLKGWVHRAIDELQEAIRLAPENKKIPRLLESIKTSLN